jgi:DNA-binding PadR family transcriptional regulator
MQKLYGITIEPKHWNRDWLEIWDFLRQAIHEVDIEAQQPIWQVIHAENSEYAA